MRSSIISVLIVVGIAVLCGKINAQGIIHIQSDLKGSGSLIINSPSVDYDAQVERYVYSASWHIISSPVQDLQKGTFVTNQGVRYNVAAGDYDLAPYNEGENIWSPYTEGTDTDILKPAKAYSMRLSQAGTITYSGKLNAGDIKIPINRNNLGWNAVGNPYSSAIRTDGTGGFFDINENTMDPSYIGLYVWNQSIGDYRILTKDPSPSPDTLYLATVSMGQGFVLKASQDNDTITFKRSMQYHTGEQIYASFKSEYIPSPIMLLHIEAGNMSNQSRLVFGATMNEGLDPGYDVGKLKGNPKLALYTELVDQSSTVDFSIQAIPDDNRGYRIPVGVDFPSGGTVRFSAEFTHFREGMEIYLEDVLENRAIRLDSPDAEYLVSVEKGQMGYGRFYLLTNKSLITNEAVLVNREINYYLSNHNLFVHGLEDNSGTIRILTVDGRILYQQQAIGGSKSIHLGNFTPGVYVLHVMQNGRSIKDKFIYSGN